MDKRQKKLLMAAALAGSVLANKKAFSSSTASKGVKCHGIAAKGANSCGARSHKCGGFAQSDFDKKEWVYVKKGTCAKLQKMMQDADLRDFLKRSTKNARKYKKNFKG